MSRHKRVSILLGVLTMACWGAAGAERAYSPAVEHPYPNRVYWGDTHLHTRLSTDANAQGNKNLGPEDAYVVARGGTVRAHNGMQVRLHRPLDFLVIADHAENLGVADGVQRVDEALRRTEVGQRLIAELQNDVAGPDALREFVYRLWDVDNQVRDEGYRRTVWRRVAGLADRYNDPGEFTAFIGYEWTSNFEGGTRHRVVVFKDGADKVGGVLPFSARDSADPEDLWRFMNRYEHDTGGEVFSIPHNPNLSSGREFAPNDGDGRPFDLAHKTLRARWEPLLEMTQMKGDSETYPVLSPNDEFADYETWGGWSVIRSEPLGADGETDLDRDLSLMKYEYARSGLKLGLGEQAVAGVNPFKFGFIGSSDAHTSIPAFAEDNFWGKHASVEPGPGRLGHMRYRWRMSASGYAAVWSRENTREALFAAMQRRETYATTGTRIVLRFFGGWDFRDDDVLRPNFSAIGYARGVPMGGDLPARAGAGAPAFMIRAVKDPDGANLDRIQVVKGWRDAVGELHEKVFDVALSDGRRIPRRGRAKPVGSTVDVATATYTNTIGAAELAAHWTDPDFDADEPAFYYVRVLEIPTPRWPAYDAAFFGVEGAADEVRTVTQERAYSSPIWYTP